MNDTLDQLSRAAHSQADGAIAHAERVHNRQLYAQEREDVYNQIFATLVAKICVNTWKNGETRATLVAKIANTLGVQV